MEKKIRNQNGVILLLSLVLMMTMAVTVSAYIYVVIKNMSVVDIYVNDTKSLYLAEAGLHKALWYLMNTAPDGSTDGSWRTDSYPQEPGPDPADPQQETLVDGSYVIWVEASGLNTMVTSRGQVNNLIRTIRQEFTSGFAPPVVLADSWREI